MKVQLNNKTFSGKLLSSNKLKIKLKEDSDRLFFSAWQNKANYFSKKDYVQDVIFTKVTEQGVLKNCFPTMSLNEDFIILNFDYYTA